MTLSLSLANRAARNAASIDLADAGDGASTLRIYTTAGGTLLATRTLQSPCGTINADGAIELAAAATIELVSVGGVATWVEWCDGNGNMIAGGDMTDESGPGPFKLSGTDGTRIYAGGIVSIDGITLG